MRKHVAMLRGRRIVRLSLGEKINTFSAAGKLIFNAPGAIACFERRLMFERTKGDIAAARAKGRTPGRLPLGTSGLDAALMLIQANLPPAQTAKQLGLGR